MARYVLDYVEDIVASRLVNVLVLIAVLGPLMHAIYVVQRELNTHYPPLFYLLSWFIFPTLACLLILLPLQCGNNYFDATWTSIVSIMWCLALFAYEAYASYALFSFYAIPWFYLICVFASAIASIICALYYCYMLCTKSSFVTYAQYVAQQYAQIAAREDVDSPHAQNIPAPPTSPGYIALLREFVWPRIPETTETGKVFYPSRVIMTVFLSLAGVIGCNELLLNYHLWCEEQLDVLHSYMETIDSVDFTERFDNIQDAMDWSTSMMKSIYFFAKPISDSLLFGSIIGLIFGVFGSFMVLRVWKQRVICMRSGVDRFGRKINVQEMNTGYPLWWSAKFIASTACSIVFGSAMIAILCAVIFGLALSIDFWSSFVESGLWLYVACCVGYYAMEWLIFQWLIQRWYFQNEMDSKYSSLILIINDLTYIPLAALFCVIRMVQLIVICLFSFIRPDLSIFPGHLATLDHGHLSFVSSVRLEVDRKKKSALQLAGNDNGENIELKETAADDAL